MDRRDFLSSLGAFAALPAFSFPQSMKSLVIVDLDGGNDGLNTVIPLDDPRYHALRPTLAIPRDRALAISHETGLHASLAPLMASWRDRHMAIVQGTGMPEHNRSHFRAKQIGDTASLEYAGEPWLNGVVHVDERTFEASCTEAARMIGQGRRTQTLRITLHGFDTHENQATRHAALLTQFARGLASMRESLMRTGDWNRTLVMSVSEFGRSAYENASRGTDHGGAAPVFLLGGSVRGGLYGTPPRFDALDIDGALPVDIDFRRVYATAGAGIATRLCFEPLPIMA